MKWKLKFKEIIISRMAFCLGKSIFEKPGRFGRATEGKWKLKFNEALQASAAVTYLDGRKLWKADISLNIIQCWQIGRSTYFGPATHFLRPIVLYCIYMLSNNMNLDARLAGCPRIIFTYPMVAQTDMDEIMRIEVTI